MLGSIRTAVAVVTVAASSCYVPSVPSVLWFSSRRQTYVPMLCDAVEGRRLRKVFPLVHLHLDAARPTASPRFPEVAGGSLLGRQAELHSYRCPRPAQVVCKAPDLHLQLTRACFRNS